jgi:hypothetical protein
MKKYINSFGLLAALVLIFTGCTKLNEPIFTDGLIEFDAAAYHSKAVGFPFPLLNRVPRGFGRATSTAMDPVTTTRTTTDTVRMRINLVGPQRTSAETVTVRVSSTFTTAIEGTHFDLLDKTVTIPANSSFGIARWVIRNPGAPPAGSPTTVQVIFELVGNESLRPSENFKYVGWTIAQ